MEAAFAIALAIKGVQLARGADTDHGLWAVAYVAVLGFWLLVDRLAERKSQEPSAARCDKVVTCRPEDSAPEQVRAGH